MSQWPGTPWSNREHLLLHLHIGRKSRLGRWWEFGAAEAWFSFSFASHTRPVKEATGLPHAHERMSDRRALMRAVRARRRTDLPPYECGVWAERLCSLHQGPGMISLEPKPLKLAAGLQKQKHFKHKASLARACFSLNTAIRAGSDLLCSIMEETSLWHR